MTPERRSELEHEYIMALAAARRWERLGPILVAIFFVVVAVVSMLKN